MPSDAEMLDWVGSYVTEVNTLMHEGIGEKIELICQDENAMEIVTRKGKDAPTAFRKCVAAAMLKIPKKKK